MKSGLEWIDALSKRSTEWGPGYGCMKVSCSQHAYGEGNKMTGNIERMLNSAHQDVAGKVHKRFSFHGVVVAGPLDRKAIRNGSDAARHDRTQQNH